MSLFDSYSRVMYAAWFIPLLIMYLTIAPTYLVCRKMPFYNKKAFLMLIATVSIYLFLFYFFLPVPSKKQNDFLNQLKGLQESNENFSSIYTTLTKNKICRDGRLNGYEYFLLQKSLNKDVDLLFKNQKSIIISSDSAKISAVDICKEV